MTYIEAATNTRRHWTAALRANPYSHGQCGEALCSTGDRGVVVYDETARKADAERWHYSFKPAADLPFCKKCARKAPAAEAVA